MPGETSTASWPARLRRGLRPPRTLRPTRAGLGFAALTLGIGAAALHSGNNLLYLVLAGMLAFLVLSGLLSEAVLRPLEVTREPPRTMRSGAPAAVALRVRHGGGWSPSFAVVVEDLVREAPGVPARVAARLPLLRLEPGGSRTLVHRFTPRSRGPLAFRAVRLSTTFPFGLFTKARTVELAQTVVVWPAPAPGPGVEVAARAGTGSGGAGVDPGAEIGGVRAFAPGDRGSQIHWPASLRTGVLTSRERRPEPAGEVWIRLVPAAASGPALETAIRAAAHAVEVAAARGAAIGLDLGPRRLPARTGPGWRARLLTELALLPPGRPEAVR